MGALAKAIAEELAQREGTGAELIHVTTGTTVSTSISMSSATAHRYVAKRRSGGTGAQAASIPVLVTWGP